jgi:hypothetical protein
LFAQEALETMVVRVIEETGEQAISAALAPPDPNLFESVSQQIAVTDAYLAMLPAMNNVLKEFCDNVLNELPTKGAAQASVESLLTVLQARRSACSLACLLHACAPCCSLKACSADQ